jgi:acetyl esterase/lipase
MSIQLKIMKLMMKKQGNSFGKDLDVAALREAGKASAAMPPEKDVEIVPFSLNGVDAEIARPQKLRNDAVILYIHGGGFISGSCKYFRSYTSYFAKMSGLEMYCIDYRLAPEHKFPAGPDDCFAAYQALLELVPGKKDFSWERERWRVLDTRYRVTGKRKTDKASCWHRGLRSAYRCGRRGEQNPLH